MSIRREFAEAADRGLYSMTELCARFGISRRVGYKWLGRYETVGLAGLEDQRRVAAHYPNRMADEVAAALLACRQAHPTWGARKLRAYLSRRQPRVAWPAASTIGTLLKRHGLAHPRRRRPHPGHPGRPLSVMDAPNAVWSVDFKGQFRLGSGAYCYPLTVVDGYSRYVLGVRGLPSVATRGVRPVFERLFREYGLPVRIRSDNGAPFATTALGRVSPLSVWWLRLGILPELIEPASPQQNGRHERMHRVLKAEATRPAAATFGAQQRRFNRFQAEYNRERPHEALGQGTPATHYTASPRPYPAQLPELGYPGHFERRYVSANGGIRWQNTWVNVSHVLAGEHVGLEEVADGVWSVYFGPVLLGRFDERDGHIRGAHNRNRL
jgi:transposase InsO family protein